MLQSPAIKYSPLLNDCRLLIQQLSNPLVSHTYREKNMVADQLAHFGMDLSGSNITFLANHPQFIIQHLMEDKKGHRKPRMGSTTNTTMYGSTHTFCTMLDVRSTSTASNISFHHQPLHNISNTTRHSVARQNSVVTYIPSTFCNAGVNHGCPSIERVSV